MTEEHDRRVIYLLSYLSFMLVAGWASSLPSTHFTYYNKAGTCSTSIKVNGRLCGEHERMFGECSQFLRGRHEAITGFCQADKLKGKKIYLALNVSQLKNSVMAEMKLSLFVFFTALIYTPVYDVSSPSSLKSFKPNLFVKAFERLLWTICQVFQMEIANLTKWAFQ